MSMSYGIYDYNPACLATVYLKSNLHMQYYQTVSGGLYIFSDSRGCSPL